MARPIVAVVMDHTRAKHGPWDEDIELVPAALVSKLQRGGALVILVPSTGGEDSGLVDLSIPALAGIVVYSLTGDGSSAASDVAAFASDRSLPYLAVSGDGSADESALQVFASALRRRDADASADRGRNAEL